MPTGAEEPFRRKRPVIEDGDPGILNDDEPNPFDEGLEELPPRRAPSYPPQIGTKPKQAPPLDKPTYHASLFGYTPNTTLGKQISRWYDNAGGLDKAIEGAQAAQANRNPRILDNLLWPKWQPSDVTKRTASSIEMSPEDPSPDSPANGWWNQNTKKIWVDSDSKHPQATLEHELSHNAYARDAGTLGTQRSASRDSPSWVLPHGGGEQADYNRYLLDPTETDVRLAEIKRHYANHTGRLVNTPEEAQKAWDWWRAYKRNFSPGFNDKIERPTDSPTLWPSDFDFYDDLPEQMKEQMLHRMPELVQAPDRIRQLRKELA
jgi:hypothetical protein